MVKQNDKREIEVFLSLGTNLGDREKNLEQAILLLEKLSNVPLQLSSLYETEAWGNSELNSFLNLVIGLRTRLSPMQLLEETQQIEKKIGRLQKTQNENYENRLIDIDLLLYGVEIYHSSRLTIPHALMHERNFVLEPLEEIASDVIFPPTGESIRELLKKCKDEESCKRIGVLSRLE